MKLTFEVEILAGLKALRKKTPPKYLYDDAGSKLFEQICELEEYYPYRAEVELLQQHAAAIAARLGEGCLLLEFGSGASVKTRLLLDHMTQLAAYAPIDISHAALMDAAQRIAAAYPDVVLHPICSDFMAELELPEHLYRGARRAVGFFPGSTIGNLEPGEAQAFLVRNSKLLGSKGMMLIGVDLLKPREVVEAAYNDRQGVTAQFNLNLLRRINQELNGKFELARFRHHATLNVALGRIEMHLVSLEAQEVNVGEAKIRFRQGESIHTENSYKYEPAQFERLAVASGFEVADQWSHPEWSYRLYCLEVA